MAKPPVAYPIIALDLDGTLLTDELQITPRSRAAIRAARERGATILLASARPPRSMLRYHHELALETPLVAYNGALVWDAAAAVSLSHQPLVPEAARALVAFLRERDPTLNISLECSDRWYIDDLTEEIRSAIEQYEVVPPHGVDCLEEVLADQAAAISKVLFPGGQRIVAELRASLPPDLAQQIHLTTSGHWFCEVMAADVTKAAAVAWVASHLGWDAGGILAIGDSLNDIPLLEAAALGIAMENAAPVVKAAADVVTASNNEEGVALAIERYILGRGESG